MGYLVEENGGYYGRQYYDKNGRPTLFLPIGKEFDITDIHINDDTNEILFELEVDYCGKRKIEIPRKEALDKSKLINYVGQGLETNSKFILDTIDYIGLLENDYIMKQKIHFQHDKLGWEEINKKKYFFGYYGKDDSVYTGTYDVKPRGNWKDWVKFVNEEVVGNTALEYAICVSASAMFLGLLRSEYVDIDNFIVHFLGDSSSGKTTALQLALSIWGKPILGAGGLMTSWSATPNALIQRVLGVNGYCFGFDELTTGVPKDFSTTVYNLAQGTEKSRLTRDSKVKEAKEGTYVLLSTGECSLLGKCNGNMGLYQRVFEVNIEKWTNSAEQSEKIKEFVIKNHGDVSVKLAEIVKNCIERKGMDALLKTYGLLRKKYCDASKIEERKERLSTRMALILLSAKFLKKKLKVNLNEEKILEFIVNNEKKMNGGQNNYNDAYEKFISWFASNRNNFQEERKQVSGNRIYGAFVKKQKTGFQVLVREKHFKDFCKEEKYEDYKQILSHFKKIGVLDCDGDRYTRRRVLEDVRELVYVIKIENSKPESQYDIKTLLKKDDNEDTDEETKCQKTKRNVDVKPVRTTRIRDRLYKS